MPSELRLQQRETFYLRDEVVVNNKLNRAWVVVHGNVFDITPLFDQNSNSPKKIHQLLLAFAGKDLSSQFNENGRPAYRISKDGVRVPMFPPVMIRNKSTGHYWWNDRSLMIGRITAQQRKIRVINNLTFQIQEITVCEEDTVADIQECFLCFNQDAKKYTWRSNIDRGDEAADLRLDKTLTENGIVYDRYPPAPIVWIFYQIPLGCSGESTENGSKQ
ncbi:cytochrome b5 domain-containing protein 1 [Ochlerotatus camptorhynchus]|uniref:cytochrome b5 domain-containing protein 1 n=1 Tax=Ochlerotatus camptorhynchus TaxID=644619 RepID=UPI0031D1A240